MNIDSTKPVAIDLKGNLLFSIAPDFERQCLISSWNSGLKFYLKSEGRWSQENIDTGLMLVCDENIDQVDEPISVFLKQLNNDVIELAKPYRYRQFTMLQLLAQNPALIDLFKHSATLFWMMVVEAESKRWTTNELIQILQQKRALQIEKLIYEPCKKSVKFLNKINLLTGKASEFRLVKKCLLNTELMESFNHNKQIPIQALGVVLRYPYFLNTKILHNEIDKEQTIASQVRKFGKYQQMINDIERMADAMHRELDWRYRDNVSSDIALNRLHENWIIRFNHANGFVQYLQERALQAEMQRPIGGYAEMPINDPLPIQQVDFPVSPIGDLDSVIQIKNNFELLAEGIVMHHCVGSYVDTALKEESYFYKVLSPERATIELRIKHGKISVLQFKLAYNQKPSPHSYAALHKAFGDYQ